MKPTFSCLDIKHNSATFTFTKTNNVAGNVVYQGDLVGLDAEDVELVGCEEILANADFIEARQTLKDGRLAFSPETFNILENDRSFAPLETTISPRNVSIRIIDRRNLDKRLLYKGSSLGISSK